MTRLHLVAVVLAFASAPAFAQSDPKTAAEAVAKVRLAYETAINARDWAGLAKLYMPDGREMPPNNPAAVGRQGIQAYHEKLATVLDVSNMKLTRLGVMVSGRHAIETGTYAQTLAFKGREPFDDRGKYLVVLQQDDTAEWRMVWAMYNSDLPTPGSAK